MNLMYTIKKSYHENKKKEFLPKKVAQNYLDIVESLRAFTIVIFDFVLGYSCYLSKNSRLSNLIILSLAFLAAVTSLFAESVFFRDDNDIKMKAYINCGIFNPQEKLALKKKLSLEYSIHVVIPILSFGITIVAIDFMFGKKSLILFWVTLVFMIANTIQVYLRNYTYISRADAVNETVNMSKRVLYSLVAGILYIFSFVQKKIQFDLSLDAWSKLDFLKLSICLMLIYSVFVFAGFIKNNIGVFNKTQSKSIVKTSFKVDSLKDDFLNAELFSRIHLLPWLILVFHIVKISEYTKIIIFVVIFTFLYTQINHRYFLNIETINYAKITKKTQFIRRSIYETSRIQIPLFIISVLLILFRKGINQFHLLLMLVSSLSLFLMVIVVNVVLYEWILSVTGSAVDKVRQIEKASGFIFLFLFILGVGLELKGI